MSVIQVMKKKRMKVIRHTYIRLLEYLFQFYIQVKRKTSKKEVEVQINHPNHVKMKSFLSIVVIVMKKSMRAVIRIRAKASIFSNSTIAIHYGVRKHSTIVYIIQNENWFLQYILSNEPNISFLFVLWSINCCPNLWILCFLFTTKKNKENSDKNNGWPKIIRSLCSSNENSMNNYFLDMNKFEKSGAEELLSMLADDELMSLKDTITKSMIPADSVCIHRWYSVIWRITFFLSFQRSEAVDICLRCSQSAMQLLRRKKIRRDILMQYLAKKSIGVSAGTDKVNPSHSKRKKWFSKLKI